MNEGSLKMPLTIDPLKGENCLYRSLLNNELTPEDLDKAKMELKETEEGKKICLHKIKEKLMKDKEIKYQMDDHLLLRYLRVTKFDIDKACEKLKHYYKIRRNYPNFFVIPDNYEAKLKNLFFKYLPFRDKEGHIIAYIKTADWNIDEMSFNDALSMNMNVCDVLGFNPAYQIYGVTIIIDAGSLGWNHVLPLMNPSTLYGYVSLLQTCYPWRKKKNLILNSNSIIRAFWRMIKPFIKTKIANRVYFLGNDLSELHEHVSPEILPPELGGTLDKKCYQPVEQYFLDNINYVKYSRSFGYVR